MAENLGIALWRATNLWQKQVAEALLPLDLTQVQFILLSGIASLASQGRTVTQNGLAQYAQTDVMMTSKVCRTLERKGFILRANNRFDSRAKALVLTKSGRAILEQAGPVMQKATRRFFAQVDAPEAFLASLNALGVQEAEALA